ncbi:PAS domain-containing protein [Methylocystis sp. IM3]|jgi:hypothetical protein|uniref:PAS domain-containing protein n=1 Tax=unclassified Methylocystis TaxID=2625913 RepID=UPI000F9204ED|nr:MAG: PAS domain-containing protein [Hyphomicrobiales bacterium]
MKQQVSKELHDYWRSLKGARLAPERNDIEFGAIRRLLANVFILQIDCSGRFPLKMCGTRINALWLDEQKERSFQELWDERNRAAIASTLSAVTDEARPVVIGARNGAGDRPRLDLEILLLPLRHFGRTHSLVLGSFALANEPDWLGRMPVGPLQIQSLRVLGSGETSLKLPARRPRLVLHEGGKAGDLFA